jgi:predicted nucleic acid-binding Zn ribbon protein
MAFCINCGAALVDGAKFCSECGTPPKGKAKRVIMILLIPIIAIVAGIAGIAGYLYIPELIRAKTESSTPTEVFLQTTATVTANTASLYAAQSAKSTVLKTLQKGEVIVVTGLPANGWAPVKSGNISGWVLLNSITVKR